MTAIKERGETPFGEAGDGCVLCFTFADLKRIQAESGGDKKFVFNITNDLISGEIDFARLEMLVRHGIKKDRKKVEIDIETGVLDQITILDLSKRLLDGLYIAVYGKNFDDYNEELIKELERRREAAKAGEFVPPVDRPAGTTSTSFDEKPSEPGSE